MNKRDMELIAAGLESITRGYMTTAESSMKDNDSGTLLGVLGKKLDDFSLEVDKYKSEGVEFSEVFIKEHLIARENIKNYVNSRGSL